MYERLEEKEDKRVLEATKLEFMDNISVKWLPENIDNEAEGSHNGQNYLAYTFYLENKGSETINYWYEIPIDDVIKNVDEAIRFVKERNSDKQSQKYSKANVIFNRMLHEMSEKQFIPFIKDGFCLLVCSKYFLNRIYRFVMLSLNS